MAAAHAQQCVYKHDTCRDVRKLNSITISKTCNHTVLPSIARFQVGQNLYIGGSSADTLGTSDWNAAVTEWYNEVKDMNTTYVTSFP
jgi:hypothetical protein